MPTSRDQAIALLSSVVETVPDEEYKEALRSAIDAMRLPRAVTGGVVFAAGQKAGHLGATLRTPDGIVQLKDAIHVTAIGPFVEDESIYPDEENSASHKLSLVKDRSATLAQRSEALADLVVRQDPDAPLVILDAIEDSRIDLEWLGILIAAAERSKFDDNGQRERLRVAVANAIRRFQTASGFREEFAWAGIRLYGSLIDRNEADCLVQFLAPSIGPDTRQVTLQAVQRVFEDAPPEQSMSSQALRDRIYEIARLYAHPDVLTFGDNAALALNAIHALAALDDSRSVECVRQITATDHRWFVDRLSDLLAALRQRWCENNVGTQSLERIDATLSECSN